MKLSRITTVTLLGLILSGCGGGGSGSSASTPVSVTPETPAPQAAATPDPLPVALQPEEQSQDSAPMSTSAELTLASEFTLNSHVKIPVHIDISGLNNTSGYLSICSRLEVPEDNEQTGEPDYGNCFVRTALPESVFDSNLDLSTAQGVAYSAIWFLDQAQEALITRHDLTNGGIRVVQ